MLKPQFIVV